MTSHLVDLTGLSSGERSTPTNSDQMQHKPSTGASPTLGFQTPGQPIDINAQLRKLLVDDEVKENIVHSSSFPASLCSTLGNGQFHQHSNSFTPRPQIPPSTSYLSSLSSGTVPNSVQQTSWMIPRNQLHHTASMFAQSTFTDGM